MESLWRNNRSEDGTALMVELIQEDNTLSIQMYVNYFIDMPMPADIQSIASVLAAQVPEINEHYEHDFSSDDNGGWVITELTF